MLQQCKVVNLCMFSDCCWWKYSPVHRV